MNPKNLFSVFMGILFCAFWLAMLAWVTPHLVAGLEGQRARLGIIGLVAAISVYWLYVGVIWVFEDWTEKKWDSVRPRRLRKPQP